jgi:ribosomal protein S18 acetylase RimI-like enzyme
VTFETAGPRPRAPEGRGIEVHECTSDDVPAVLDIAGAAFKFTRFHLDPAVPATMAHAIKREWIANYAKKKRGDRLFVAMLDGRPAGFNATLTTESGGKRSAVIDLIAVASHAQRRGVGEALVGAFFEHYRGYDTLVVGTQVANVPSVRLYEKLGFRLTKSHYVLHKHVPAAKV